MKAAAILTFVLLALPAAADFQLPECQPDESLTCALHAFRYCSSRGGVQGTPNFTTAVLLSPPGEGVCRYSCANGAQWGYNCDSSELPDPAGADPVPPGKDSLFVTPRGGPEAYRAVERMRELRDQLPEWDMETPWTTDKWSDTCPLNPKAACAREAFERCGVGPFSAVDLAIERWVFVGDADGGVCDIQCAGHRYSLFCNAIGRDLLAEFRPD